VLLFTDKIPTGMGKGRYDKENSCGYRQVKMVILIDNHQSFFYDPGTIFGVLIVLVKVRPLGHAGTKKVF